MTVTKRSTYLILLASLLAASLRVQMAFASGPGEGGRRVRLDNESAGPYLLRVVTSPTPPKVENYNVEVRVIEAATGTVLTDVTVVIIAIPMETGGELIRQFANHEFAPIPNEYAAHLVVYEEGLWNITVEVNGDLGRGEVTFIERISNPVNLGWLVAFGPPLVGISILIIVFMRLQRNAQQSRKGPSSHL